MRKLLLVMIAIVLMQSVQAQFFEKFVKPQLTVPLTYPPELGLIIKKVAFGPPMGEGSDRIINDLTTSFVNNNIEVLDRQDLNSILSEHNLTLSGYIDQSTAASIGRLLGPSDLIFVRVDRCETTQQESYDQEKEYDSRSRSYYYATGYFSTTRAFLHGSVQVVDLTTGRIFHAFSFNYSPQQQNKSFQGYPVYPAAEDVKDQAFTLAENEIDHLFFPWTVQTTLYYFNDKEGGLRQAFDALKAQDFDGCFSISSQNLGNCIKDPKTRKKTLGHAYYNMGMSYMFRDECDSALDDFQQAEKYSPGDIVDQAIVDCRKKKELLSSMQQVEQKASLEETKSEAMQKSIAQEEINNTLTNDAIISMTKEKLPPDIIIAKIKHSKCNFDTSPNALAKLEREKVNEKVVEVMISQ